MNYKKYIFFLLVFSTTDLYAQDLEKIKKPKIVSRTVSVKIPNLYGAMYVDRNGFNMRSENMISNNNAESWEASPMTPNFALGLPKGYRLNPVASVLDPYTGRNVTIVNALDVEDLDPTIAEPPIAQQTYYLRYRISDDSSKTWLFDEPIIHKGNFTKENPLPGVFIGKNSIYLGDKGSIPIVTKDGKILVPAQTTLIDKDGKPWNPGNGHTYTDVVVLIGEWINDSRISWTMSDRIEGDPLRSTRGMIEPTLLEVSDGRLLMIMRGSNAKRGSSEFQLPGYKWYSVSNDSGKSWSKPEPFRFDDGIAFHSPSSMSTLFKHSSGRSFWLGNVTEKNSEGNLPRWPLVFAELDTKDLTLVRSSALTVDTYREEDKSRGRLDISHFDIVEDRKTKEIIVTYPRSYNSYKSKEWVETRIVVE